jgi:hypothetical protein
MFAQLSWTSSAPDGTWYQVYVQNHLAWDGQQTRTELPVPGGRVRVVIGSVDPGEEAIDFGATLPPLPALYATLSWLGGTYEDADLAGFHVYGSTAPGGPISYTTPLASLTAYPSGIYNDGFGLGGFGAGGFGESASSYSWTSSQLTNGLWSFSVKPFDMAGNDGTEATTAVAILGPPGEPSVISGLARLIYTYDFPSKEATLTWGASPG